MSVELRDYQKEAVKKLSSGSVLCGGVGSGKSVTGISFYLTTPHDHLYIITTPKKRDSKEWEREISKFEELKEHEIVVDSWNNIKKYEDVDCSFFIFDEQRVVGNGGWVHAFLRIAKKNEWILLTATPGDTWMDYIPVFVANGYYKNRTAFIRRHVVYARNVRYPVVERYLEVQRLTQLKARILVEMSYRPSAIMQTHELRVGYDKAIYNQVLRTRSDPNGNPLRDISAVCRVLRRVCVDVDERFAAIKEILARRDKIIIFYNFDYELERLRELSTITTVAEWNGHKHEQIPSTDRWVYLVNYLAGAEAWECTATDTMIFYSLSYSYKMMVQASGRINRCNTPYFELHYYYFHSGAPIENAIEKALREKKNFNELGFLRSKTNLT